MRISDWSSDVCSSDLKVGMGEGGLKPDRIRAAVQGSLDRLGVDVIDLYFAHKDDPDVPLDEMLGAFGELVDAGQVRAIGASNYSAERLAEALRVSAETRLPRFTVMRSEEHTSELPSLMRNSYAVS